MAIVGQRRRDDESQEIVSYRNLPSLNYSSIKVFHKEGPGSFYKKFIQRFVDEDDETDEKKSIIIGNILDFGLNTCNGNLTEFDNRWEEEFALFNGIKGDTQEFALGDELYRETVRCLNEDGVITVEFSERFQRAFQKLQAKGRFKGKSIAKGLELFCKEKRDENENTTSALKYFEEKIRNHGRQLVDLFQISCGRRMVEQGMTDPWVADVFHSSLETRNKVVLEWTAETVQGPLKCKAELDKTLWDYDNRIVYVKDVKSVFDNRKEQIKQSYKSYLYGFQAVHYLAGMRQFLKDNSMSDWTLGEFEFLFFSTGNLNRPHRMVMHEGLVHEALFGYNDGYRWIKGYHQIMEEIAWAEYNGVYNTEMEISLNNGYITI